MLDSNFNAKLGNFGLARLVDHKLGSQTPIWQAPWTQGGSRHLVFAMVQEPYIQRPFEEGPFDFTTKDMGSEFRYTLGKVLGTQDCPTLRLASHLCVLYLNLIKSMFNTCILTHTHTSIHLSIHHGIIHPKPQHTSIMASKHIQGSNIYNQIKAET